MAVADDAESSESVLEGAMPFGELADGRITVLLLPKTSIEESMVMVIGTTGSSQEVSSMIIGLGVMIKLLRGGFDEYGGRAAVEVEVQFARDSASFCIWRHSESVGGSILKQYKMSTIGIEVAIEEQVWMG